MIIKILEHSRAGTAINRLDYVARGSSVGGTNYRDINVCGLSTIDVAAEMEATASRSRRVQVPHAHLVMSWRPDERPSDEQMYVAAIYLLAHLGLSEHQARIAIHRRGDANYDDGEHAAGDHVHVVVNRVHPVTHLAARMSHGHSAVERIARELEAQHGYAVDNGRFAATVAADGTVTLAAKTDDEYKAQHEAKTSSGSRQREMRTGEQPLEHAARPHVLEAIATATSWHDLHRRLGDVGLVYEKKGNGAVIRSVLDRSDVCKASLVARDASLAKLVARWGAYQPPTELASPVNVRQIGQVEPTNQAPVAGDHGDRRPTASATPARGRRDEERDPKIAVDLAWQNELDVRAKERQVLRAYRQLERAADRAQCWAERRWLRQQHRREDDLLHIIAGAGLLGLLAAVVIRYCWQDRREAEMRQLMQAQHVRRSASAAVLDRIEQRVKADHHCDYRTYVARLAQQPDIAGSQLQADARVVSGKIEARRERDDATWRAAGLDPDAVRLDPAAAYRHLRGRHETAKVAAALDATAHEIASGDRRGQDVQQLMVMSDLGQRLDRMDQKTEERNRARRDELARRAADGVERVTRQRSDDRPSGCNARKAEAATGLRAPPPRPPPPKSLPESVTIPAGLQDLLAAAAANPRPRAAGARQPPPAPPPPKAAKQQVQGDPPEAPQPQRVFPAQS